MRALKFMLFSTLIVALFSCDNKSIIEQPNFIIFIADDVSWNDLGCYGNEVVQTPNIDKIASKGVRFTNTYLTTSSCSPSRISIMSGRYPHNTGAAELHTTPNANLATMASVLKAHGYYTGQAGKWHMGKKFKAGFDIVQEGTNNGDGGEALWVESVQNRDKSKPFFFWFAADDAHREWGPNEFSGTHDPNNANPPVTLFNGAETRKDLAQYYDEIKRFDYYIGKVEEELQSQGVLDNTVIIIMADNGRPFPRDKTRVYDSGMKTPFIVKWPSGIREQGAVSNSLVSSIDIAPTLLDLSNITMPESFQGKSFKSVLNNTSESFRKYVFAEHNWHDFEAHERMVRDENYLYVLNSRPEFANQGPADAIRSLSFSELVNNKDKLSPAQADIFMAPRPKEELYDLRTDSLQLHNLMLDDDHQEIGSKLANVLHNWMEETDDNIPENITKDWYSRTLGTKIDSAINIRGEMPGASKDADKTNNKGVF